MRRFNPWPCLLLLCLPVAQAATYYVSDCAPGASACRVGDDNSTTATNPATPWRTTAKVQTMFPTLQAGDKVLFAQGGLWTGATLNNLSNLRSSAASPITLADYVPAWGAGPRPRFVNTTATASIITFSNNGSPTHDGGYVLRNLDLQGGGVARYGVMTYNDVWDVVIDNVNFNGFEIGFHCHGGTTQTVFNPGSDGTSRNYVVRNSSFTNNSAGGILSACLNTLIENNVFDRNGTTGHHHHVYLHGNLVAGAGVVVTDTVVRGNTLTNNNIGPPGSCVGVALVVHGLRDRVLIENNMVREDAPPATDACWGISVDSGSYPTMAEGFERVSIRGNTVINFGMGVGLDICRECVVENNSIYTEFERGGMCLASRSKAFQPMAADESRPYDVTVRNNSCYIKAPNGSSMGYRISRNAADAPTAHHVFVSNFVYFGLGSTATTQCFNTANMGLGEFDRWDHNLCFAENGIVKWDSVRGSLAANQAAGLDVHSSNANPNLNALAAPNLWPIPKPDLPLRGAGHTTRSSTRSINGVARDRRPDIGAVQLP